MELFGLAAAIPAAFLLSALYQVVLLRLLVRFEWVARLFRPASAVVLGLFVAEVILVATVGSIRIQQLSGSIFNVGHLIVVLRDTPALANLLLIRGRDRHACPWYVVSLSCAAMAFLLVLLQYKVSEELFGIDGDGVPFG